MLADEGTATPLAQELGEVVAVAVAMALAGLLGVALGHAVAQSVARRDALAADRGASFVRGTAVDGDGGRGNALLGLEAEIVHLSYPRQREDRHLRARCLPPHVRFLQLRVLVYLSVSRRGQRGYKELTREEKRIQNNVYETKSSAIRQVEEILEETPHRQTLYTSVNRKIIR